MFKCLKDNPARKKAHTKAFTLIESLVTILLVSLVFGAIASLLHGVFRTLRYQSAKVAILQVGQFALERISNEAREANELVSASSSTLVLKKIEPSSARLPSPPFTATSWDPLGSVSTIRYTLAGTKIVREVTSQAGVTTRTTVADQIVGFVVRESEPGGLEIAVSVQEETKVTPVKGKVLMSCYRE